VQNDNIPRLHCVVIHQCGRFLYRGLPGIAADGHGDLVQKLVVPKRFMGLLDQVRINNYDDLVDFGNIRIGTNTVDK
jgi:hypothetical protein